VTVSPFVRGGALALVAACAFGVTTPLVQRFGAHVGPFATAALLYAGAAGASWLPVARQAGAKLRMRQAPRLALVALAGAVVAPACLAWGLQRTSAVAASLLLNLESVFTVVLARVVFREPFGRQTTLALASIVAGGAVLAVASSHGGDAAAGTQAGGAVLGALVVAAATLAWAIDNTLTRPLAEVEASSVVLAKGGLGALGATFLALIAGEPRPALGPSVALLACGATGYGASLRLYLGAQRALGAARTASIFAVAPFVGALAAVALGDRPPLVASLGAAALCGVGVALHLSERHAHLHSHPAATHEHLHRHDDAHHDHPHEPPVVGEHSHAHSHVAVTHEHEHAPDVHHSHDHDHDHDPA
jgi:drug/metabolite transporter (DMT)-like permease